MSTASATAAPPGNLARSSSLSSKDVNGTSNSNHVSTKGDDAEKAARAEQARQQSEAAKIVNAERAALKVAKKTQKDIEQAEIKQRRLENKAQTASSKELQEREFKANTDKMIASKLDETVGIAKTSADAQTSIFRDYYANKNSRDEEEHKLRLAHAEQLQQLRLDREADLYDSHLSNVRLQGRAIKMSYETETVRNRTAAIEDVTAKLGYATALSESPSNNGKFKAGLQKLLQIDACDEMPRNNGKQRLITGGGGRRSNNNFVDDEESSDEEDSFDGEFDHLSVFSAPSSSRNSNSDRKKSEPSNDKSPRSGRSNR